VFGGIELLLMYSCSKTDNLGAHSTPSKKEHDGFTDIQPSYASYDCLFVNGKFAASYCTDIITYPKAVFVLVNASPDIDLNSKTKPLSLYDSKFYAMLDNQGNIA
jgi:hypothetical protein